MSDPWLPRAGGAAKMDAVFWLYTDRLIKTAYLLMGENHP